MEHPLVALGQRMCFSKRIVAARRRKNGGQPSGLVFGQVTCRFIEVVPGGRFGAVDTGAPLGHVEVQLEDALFRQLMLQRPGDQRFLSLSEERALGREIQIFASCWVMVLPPV